MTRRGIAVLTVTVCGLLAGCGTTRLTDTQRAASEMMLCSQAVDNAVAQIDCAPLTGQPVYLDTQYLDGTVDKGYVISSLRQHLLASGAMLLEDRKSATVVVEARSGAVGTDRSGLLILGTPQMSLPSVVAGQPTQIPELGLIKKTDMKGVAKLAVFAYNRQTGQAVWQSGLVEARSTSRDLWVLGAGPFSSGSIRRKTELAGEELPVPFAPTHDKGAESKTVPASAVQPAAGPQAQAPTPPVTQAGALFPAGPQASAAIPTPPVAPTR